VIGVVFRLVCAVGLFWIEPLFDAYRLAGQRRVAASAKWL